MASSSKTVYAASLAFGLAFFSGVFLGVPGEGRTARGSQADAPRQGGRANVPAKAAPAPAQIVEGTDEDDTLNGGTGDDWLFGKKGDDVVRGGGGRDKLDGGEGNDTLDGGADADIIDAGAGADTVRGGDGDDVLDGGDDDDLLDGGAGNDDIDGGDGSDVLRGGPGNDLLAGGDENDSLSGAAGNDRLSGQDGADNLSGGAGDDVLLGGDGDDALAGDAGDDRLDGGAGSDLLRGGAGNDTLLGSWDADTLQGGEGHDTLLGGEGADVLNGGVGHDWLLGGPGADVIAAGEGDDLIVIRAGDVPKGEIEVIDGGSGADVLILNGFAAAAALPRGSPTAEWQLVDPITGGIYRIVNVERVEYTQALAQVEEGANRPVSVLLINPTTSASTGRVLFFGPDGSIVPAVSGNQPARDDLTFTVPPLGSLRIEAVVKGPVTAQVFAASPLGVMVRGGVVTGGSSGTGESALVDSAIVPVLENRTAGVSTGVVIANSIAQSNIKLTLHGPDGRELDGQLFVGAKELDFPPYGHRVLLVRDLFPALTDFQGTLTIDGGLDRPQEGGPISVIAVERGSSGNVGSSPAIPMHRGREAEPLYLARVTTGGETTSSLLLVNPSLNANAQGTLRFFDAEGRPWPVAVNRQAPAASVAYNVGPRGMAVFTTASGGAVQQGSVRAEPTQGAVGLLLRAVSAGGDVLRVPAGGAFSRGLAAVRREAAGAVTTRVSLSSTGAAVTVRLTLRGMDGKEVAGGAAEVRLAANGQRTGTIEQLFPSAATDSFEGTLTVTVEGGTAAATVVQVGPGQRQVVLPLVPLQ